MTPGPVPTPTATVVPTPTAIPTAVGVYVSHTERNPFGWTYTPSEWQVFGVFVALVGVSVSAIAAIFAALAARAAAASARATLRAASVQLIADLHDEWREEIREAIGVVQIDAEKYQDDLRAHYGGIAMMLPESLQLRKSWGRALTFYEKLVTLRDSGALTDEDLRHLIGRGNAESVVGPCQLINELTDGTFGPRVFNEIARIFFLTYDPATGQTNVRLDRLFYYLDMKEAGRIKRFFLRLGWKPRRPTEVQPDEHHRPQPQ